MRLFLDITRITTRIIGSTPTGIDRVEFAYASEILHNHPHIEAHGVLTTPLFTGALRPLLLKDVLGRVERAWRLRSRPAEDEAYQALKAILTRPAELGRQTAIRLKGRSRFERFRRGMIWPVRDLVRAPARLRRRLRAGAADAGRFYLNVSHAQLQQTERFAWTRSASLRPVFFIHDAIPIDFPEFVSPGGRQRHIGRLNTVAQLASLIIVNSATTARAVTRRLAASGLRIPEMEVIPLGVADWFLDARALDAPLGAAPYFVCVGTIEPRKNLLFLFAVWRALVEKHGAKTPRLIIVGARGWENENIVDVLERSRALAPYVIEISDLTDAGLASLLLGSAGLVSPSTIEGFGLPVVEALALGVPVIASDIEAHREIAAGRAMLLDPIDGRGWLAAIEGLMGMENAGMENAGRREGAKLDVRPLDWAGHVSRAVAAIAEAGSVEGMTGGARRSATC